MSLNLVSPGVKVREVDLTIGNISGAQELVGAIAGPFEKGPIDVPILIENEQDLIATYGKPLETDGQFEYWMTASSYLSYGGVLRVLRSDSTNLNNANAGVSIASTTVKIKSYDDYTANYTLASDWFYAAKNPGTWGNGLKVFTIDNFADQVISGVGTAGITVGMGVTQVITGRTRVGPGTETTYGSGFVRGIITGVGTAAGAGIGTDAVTVKVVDRVTAGGIVSATNYDELKFLTSTSETETTNTSTGIGTTTGIVDTAFDITITGISTLATAAGIDQNIALGDVVTSTGGASVVAAGTTVVAIGTSAITVDKAITGIDTSGSVVFTFTRTTGVSTTTNTNTTFFIQANGDAVSNETTTTVTDWYNSQKLGLTKGVDISWNTIAEKPGTSEYAASRQSANDEMHVVVVDEDGSASGIAGNVLEKHLYLSKAKDGKRQPAEEVYYKNYLANRSEYIYAGAAPSGTASGLTAVNSGSGDTDIKDFAVTSGNWGSNAAGVTYNVEGNRSYDLVGGKDYSGTDGYLVGKGDVINSYNILKNPAEYSINFILQGPSGGATIFESQAKASALISIASLRKDCIACISPHRAGVVNVSNSDTQTDNIVDYYAALQSSSYAVFDSGYKYTFDRFNNEFRYIPLNGDIGGLMARTSINSFSWFSPAGASRGAINGAVKLAYNPTQAQRDIIYPKRINPVIASPGAGIILFGDRTGLGVASAFDRINVRRLFLTLEDTIERAARDQLFEFNDVITRTNFLNIVDPFLRDVKAKRGITDFVVICDETNNTPDVIDANQFRADIFVKPARSINFIGLTFVATRTGVSFEEVVGNV
jgi:hypothetical protein